MKYRATKTAMPWILALAALYAGCGLVGFDEVAEEPLNEKKSDDEKSDEGDGDSGSSQTSGFDGGGDATVTDRGDAGTRDAAIEAGIVDDDAGSSCSHEPLCENGVFARCENGVLVETDCLKEAGVCQIGTCDPQEGCGTIPKTDGTACDDGRFCTAFDHCIEGTCVPEAETDCSQLNSPCTSGVCNEDRESCEAVPINTGGSCGTGLVCEFGWCTVGDACTIDGCTLACGVDSGSCNLGCNAGFNCDFTCQEGATCVIDCAGSGDLCMVECLAGSTCKVHCATAAECANVYCPDTADCQLTCDSAECGVVQAPAL
ncbi:MAG: hypothetical protein OEZ06_15975 [Myxococcales bacterium]|nr:hypothetical protein [Myxococcales bacterium]